MECVCIGAVTRDVQYTCTYVWRDEAKYGITTFLLSHSLQCCRGSSGRTEWLQLGSTENTQATTHLGSIGSCRTTEEATAEGEMWRSWLRHCRIPSITVHYKGTKMSQIQYITYNTPSTYVTVYSAILYPADIVQSAKTSTSQNALDKRRCFSLAKAGNHWVLLPPRSVSGDHMVESPLCTGTSQTGLHSHHCTRQTKIKANIRVHKCWAF